MNNKKYVFCISFKLHFNAYCLLTPTGKFTSFYIFFSFFLIEPIQSYYHEILLWYLKIFLTSKIPYIQFKRLQKKVTHDLLNVESIRGLMPFHRNYCPEVSIDQSMDQSKYKDINIKQDVFSCGSRHCYIVTTEMTNIIKYNQKVTPKTEANI